MKTNPPKTYLTMSELGRLTGRSEPTVRRAVYRGEITPDVVLRTGPGLPLVNGFSITRLNALRRILTEPKQ